MNLDEAFVELEKQQEQGNCCDNQTEIVTNNVTVTDETIISGNLKSAIEQELADSSNL